MQEEISSAGYVVKIQSDILQGESLALLLFVVAIISHNFIFMNCTENYSFTRKHYLPNLDDIKVSAKTEKEQKTLTQKIRIYS